MTAFFVLVALLGVELYCLAREGLIRAPEDKEVFPHDCPDH